LSRNADREREMMRIMNKSQNELRFGRKNNTIGSRNYSPNKYKNLPKQTMNWAIIIFLGRKEY